MSEISNENMIADDLQLMYADIVTKIFNSWTHLDDDACEHVSIGTKQIWTMNSVTAVYQPIREKGETSVQSTEEGYVILYPNKEFSDSLSKKFSDSIKFSSETFNKAKPKLRLVEDKLIESYNSYVKKYNGWIEDVPRESLNFEKLANILKPIHYDEKSKKIKIKWSIKYLYNGVSRNWNPVELMNWMYSLPAYVKYRKVKNIKDVQETIEFLNNELTKPPEERELTIEQSNNIINKLKEKLENPITLETEYNEGYDEEYIKRKVYGGFKLINIQNPLKRKRDSDNTNLAKKIKV